MKKLLKNYYLFLVLFILFIAKDGIYRLINIHVEENTTCIDIIDKYNTLLEFNNIDYVYNEGYINTYIIYKDIYDYMDRVTIRGGKDYNLDNNLILYNNTLVGIINKVYDTYSSVLLLTSKDTQISVKINDEIGVLTSTNNTLIVKNISNYSNVSVGDSIYTSGMGNIKENIYIGRVKSITLDNKNIEKYIEVDYNISIKDIDYVTIYGVEL